MIDAIVTGNRATAHPPYGGPGCATPPLVIEDNESTIDMVGRCMTRQDPAIHTFCCPENTMRTEDIQSSKECIPEEIFIPEEPETPPPTLPEADRRSSATISPPCGASR